MEAAAQVVSRREVQIPSGESTLHGELGIPEGVLGMVLFAHGSGSSRHSPRNQYVARMLRDAGMGTLLFDLLTREEEAADAASGHLRFDIQLLAERLLNATRWLREQPDAARLPVGYFGASTGGAAALAAAAAMGDGVRAVVSRGGRPDLAGEAVPRVTAPTLLIVGGDDTQVIRLNQMAYARLQCPKQLTVIPGASHLFDEQGALESVADYAGEWFRLNLQSAG